jgi:hypothetical protein
MNRAWLARAALLAGGLGAATMLRGKAPVETEVTIKLESAATAEQVTVRVGTLAHEWHSTATFHPQGPDATLRVRPNVAPGTYLIEVDIETKVGSRTQEHRVVLNGSPVVVYGPR